MKQKNQNLTSSKDIEISYIVSSTQLGIVTLGATVRGICFIQFGDSEEELYEQLLDEYPLAKLNSVLDINSAEISKWIKTLDLYLKGQTRILDLPLDLLGTAFQIKVWNYLQTIPIGKMVSYTNVAEAIGKPKAVRAVATACARNNIAIAVPCHRVIRGSGELAGYRWGLERKRALIALESNYL